MNNAETSCIASNALPSSPPGSPPSSPPSSQIHRLNFPALGEPVGPYVHAVSHAGLLYVSGLTAFGTAAAGASLPEQTDAVLRQLRLIAEESGSSLENLLKVTLYITDLTALPELRTTLFQHYGAHLPASSVVQVQGLFVDTVNIEIEAIIALPQLVR